ncbi:MAG: sigma 54-interacting transcriptional regulator [bacterium]
MFAPAGPAAERPLGFFGRDAELARIKALADEVREGGRGRAVLVTGPSGVGKSRLMAELKRRLREDGEVALECWCRHADPRPHGPLVDLLAAGAASMHEVGRRAPRTERALNLLTGLAPPEVASPTADRTPAFQETVRQALIELSDVHPSVLFVHDVHWADRATLDLVRYLLENMLSDPAFDWTPADAGPEADSLVERSFRGLMVISFREDDTTRPLLEVARATAAVEHVPLAGLDADAVRAFLQSPAVVERVLAASEGMPLTLEQIIDAIPEDPHALWQQQIEALPPAARALLDVLAVYRRACTLEQLAALADADDARAGLAVLVRRNIVRRALSEGIIRFRFTRPAAREAWYAAMDPERRRALHRRVAERLAAGLGAEPERIARHFLAGDATEDAIPYALAAADRLQGCFAHTRAAALLEEVEGSADGPLRAEILDRLAELYAASGDPDAARRALRALAAVDPERAGPVLDARRARLLALAGDHAGARKLAEATLTAPALPEATRRELTALAADAAYREGDLTAAAALAAPLAAPLADTDGDDVTAIDARNTLGKVHLAREALDDAAALFTRNLDASARLALPDHQARALISLGVVDLQRGDVDAALARFKPPAASAPPTATSPTSRSRSKTSPCSTTAARTTAALGYTTSPPPPAAASAGAPSSPPPRSTSPTSTSSSATASAPAASPTSPASTCAATASASSNRSASCSTATSPAPTATPTAPPTATPPPSPASSKAAATSASARSSGRRPSSASRPATSTAPRPSSTRPSRSPAPATRSPRGSTSPAAASSPPASSSTPRSSSSRPRSTPPKPATTARPSSRRKPGSPTCTGPAKTAPTPCKPSPAPSRPSSASPPSSPPRCSSPTATPPAAAPSPTPSAGSRRPLPRRPPRRRPRPPPPRRRRLLAPWGERYPQIIGRAPTLYPVFNALDRVAGSDSMVLIRGESGTGKELVAAALHRHSPRADGPFVKVNCAAFVETLLLSELFGHEKGAFTGAISSKKGRFELADGGTLFLDEIGDISPNTQVALLRVLQEGTFERVGGAETLTVDVRVICATHRNLEQMVREGSFRADLYYRLRGIILEVPPLRERRPDIPLLVEHFLARRPGRKGRALRFGREALASLIAHDWPGNVRELENVVRSVALFADGDVIGLSELMELGDMFRPPDEQALVALHEMLDHEPPPEPEPAPAPPPPSRPSPPLPHAARRARRPPRRRPRRRRLARAHDRRDRQPRRPQAPHRIRSHRPRAPPPRRQHHPRRPQPRHEAPPPQPDHPPEPRPRRHQGRRARRRLRAMA